MAKLTMIEFGAKMQALNAIPYRGRPNGISQVY
jgi:hypothetical protein